MATGKAGPLSGIDLSATKGPVRRAHKKPGAVCPRQVGFAESRNKKPIRGKPLDRRTRSEFQFPK
jgi:hypothetical protein